MNQLIIENYLQKLRDCWNCGKKAPEGQKCPCCGALPERPRLYVERPMPIDMPREGK